jgi:hypothetical protein
LAADRAKNYAYMLLEPENAPEASKALKEIAANHNHVWLCGLGHGIGSLAANFNGLVLSSKKLAEIAIEPGNLLAIAGAGLTVEALDTALAPTGLYWPITGPSERSLGGIMNEGVIGAQTMAKGTINDWILGAAFLSASGEIITSGGRTLKNVCGYDLTRLTWRSHGALAMCLSFIVKLLPRPHAAPVMEYPVSTLEEASLLLEKVLVNRISPWGLRLVGDQDGLRIVAWLGGFSEMVENQQSKLAAILGPASITVADGFGYFKAHNLKWPTGLSELTYFMGSRKNILNLLQLLEYGAKYRFDADIGGGRIALTPCAEELKLKAQKALLSPVDCPSHKLGGHIFRRLKTFLDPNQTFQYIS